jgi:hypothetical protein
MKAASDSSLSPHVVFNLECPTLARVFCDLARETPRRFFDDAPASLALSYVTSSVAIGRSERVCEEAKNDFWK